MSFDVEKEVREAFPCQCHKAWTGRGRHNSDNPCYYWDEIEDFATRAIAAERERCAAECRRQAEAQEKAGNPVAAVWAANGCALAIRASAHPIRGAVNVPMDAEEKDD
jgi:hypothetical protein